MSVTLYASKDEIKNILGITGTSKDILIRQFARAMKSVLDGILGVSGLELRTVTDELQKNYLNEGYFYVHEFNPTAITGFKDMDGTAILAEEITNGHFSVIPGSRKILAKYGVNYEQFKVTYTAGYICHSTITVTDYTALEDKTITIGETVITESDVAGALKFNAATSNAATATAIAASLTAAGINATAVGAVVTLGVSDDMSTDSTLAVTLTESNIPAGIKLALAYMVGGAMAQRQGLGGISSYTLGAKTVSFRSTTEKEEFIRIVDQFMSNFKRVIIASA